MLRIYYLVYVLLIVSILAGLVFGFLYRRNSKLNPIRLFFIENVLAFISGLFIQHNESGRHVYYAHFNLSFFLELIFFYYYFATLIHSRLFKRILLACFLLISGICLYFWTSPQYGVFTFMPFLIGTQNLFIIIPCLMYIYQLFKSEEDMDLNKIPHFYIACAVLFYYGATFPFFMTYEGFYQVTRELTIGLSIVQLILEVILNLTFIKAFLCPYPERK